MDVELCFGGLCSEDKQKGIATAKGGGVYECLCCAGRNYFCGDAAAVLLSRAEALHEGGGCFETLRFI